MNLHCMPIVRSLIPFFLLALAGCAMQTARSTVVPPESLAPHLASQPRPQWHVPLTVEEIDYATFVAQDRLLVATLDLKGTGNIWTPEPGDLALFDTAQGQLLWSVPVTSLMQRVQSAFGMGARIGVLGPATEGHGLAAVALDAATGTVAWRRDEPAGSAHSVALAAKLLLLQRTSGDQLAFTAVDLDTGKDRWTANVAAEGGLSVQMIDDGVLTIGRHVTLISTDTGKVRWSLDIGEAPKTAVVAASDALLVFSAGNRLYAIDARSGRERWRTEPGEEVVTPVLEHGLLAVLERTAAGGHAIRRLDLASGRTLWTVTPEGALRSPLLVTPDTVYYTTAGRLVGLSASGGATRVHGTLPAALRSPAGLPDNLLVRGEQVIVAREVGVAAFRSGSGQLVFAEYVHGARPFTHDFLSYKLLARRSGASGPSAALAGLAPGVVAASSQLARQTADINIRASQMNLDYVRMQTRSVLESPTSTSTERISALNMQESAIRSNYAIESAAAQAQLAAATAQLGQSFVGLGMAYRGSWVVASLKLAEAQANWTRTTHAQSIQQQYYVRPFYDEGWGVTLVRLTDGRRADLYVSPPNEPLLINAANLPVFLVEPGRNRLLAKGLGVGLSDVPTYDKVAWPATLTGMFGLPDKFTIPFPSLLAYDLAQLKFRSGSARPAPANPWPTLGEREQKLRQVILSGNEDGVKALLAQGADPNALDQYGLNALFYAALVDHKAIAKELVAKGVDGTLRDDHGWQPLHYAFLSKADTRSAPVLWEASKKTPPPADRR